MTPSDGAFAPSIDGLKQVRVSDIEGELAQRAQSADRSGVFVSRACSLNLVAFVENLADVQTVFDMIDDIATAHPMRVLVTMVDQRVPEPDVHAWVSLECGDEVAGSLLCSEQIALAANPDSTARLVSSVSALLSADLPVALWWRAGSPFLNRLFKGLAPLADKVVVDSKLFGDGPAARDTLHRLNGLRNGRMALADMNWQRIATWRSTLSACFDDPAVLPLLQELDRSEIDFSMGAAPETSRPPSARSLLLAGWIVSRLPSIAGHGDIAGKPSAWASPGSIIGLRLRSSSSRAGVSIAWESPDAGICATAFDRDGRALRRWRFSPDPEGEAELLYRCVDSVAVDRLLDGALEVG